jgi:hypothetical protein
MATIVSTERTTGVTRPCGSCAHACQGAAGLVTLPPGNPGYNRPRSVVEAEVISAHHRNVALLVAGCYFMEMLDGTNVIVS